MKEINKLKQELMIMKMFEIKPNYSELARMHKCDRRTVKKYDEGYKGKSEHRNNRVKFEFSDTKTRDSRRIVPITKVLLNDLKMLYEQDKKEYYGFNDDFFVVSDAKPIADSNIYLRRTKLANLAGLKVIRIHDFRHSCASLLINNGANVTLVAKYLGHTKIEETLNTYSHMFSTALDSVVSVIDNLDSKS